MEPRDSLLIDPAPNGRLGLVAGACVTLVVHLAVGLVYVLGDSNGAHAETPTETGPRLELVITEVVALGDVVPSEDELPRITNPAPETSAAERVILEPDEPPPVERQTPTEMSQSQVHLDEVPRDSTRHNSARPVNTEPLYGRQEGFRGGISLSAEAQTNLFARTQLQIQRAFRPPASIPDEVLHELEGTVLIEVNADGRILDHHWVRRSGNRLFDSALERAINTFRLGRQRLHLPTSNQQAMDLVLEHGFEVTVRP